MSVETDAVEKIENYMLLNEFFMKCNGMWPLGTSRPMQILGTAFTVLVVLSCLQLFILVFVDLIKYEGNDMEKITSGLTNLLIYAMGCIQILHIVLRPKSTLKLANIVNTGFRFESAKGVKQINMQDSFLTARKLTQYWMAGCIMSVVLTTLYPALTSHKFVNGTRIRVLPLEVWYPFDDQISPNYELAYLSQAVGQAFMGIIFGNVDAFVIVLVILTCGQFRLLKCSLMNIRYTAMLNCGVSKKDLEKFAANFDKFGTLKKDAEQSFEVKNQLRVICDKNTFDGQTWEEFVQEDLETYTNRYDVEVEKAMKDCIAHHHEILDYCAFLQDFCSTLIFTKIIYATLFLCLLAFATVSTENDLVRTLNRVEYILIVATEIFMYTYFGDLLTRESIGVRDAIYKGPWYTCSTRFKKSMCFMVMRCNHPVMLSGIRFFNLSFETFLAILKTSFSYYTLLKSVTEQ